MSFSTVTFFDVRSCKLSKLGQAVLQQPGNFFSRENLDTLLAWVIKVAPLLYINWYVLV